MKHRLLALLSIGLLLTGCGGGGGGGETASGSSGYNTTTAPAGGTTAVADPVLNGQFTAGGTPAAASLEQTLAVTVQAVGNANKYFIDGAQQSELSLEVGTTYTLDQSDASNAGHPLRFSITDDGTHSGGVEYTADVGPIDGTPGQAGAYTKITPTAATPALLYYYCTNHAGMGGQADVTNVGGANNAAVNGVQGLSYATETQSGVTDSTGAFTYKSGETIQFSIGNFALGDAVLAVEDMNPVDLVTGVVLPTAYSEIKFLFERADKGSVYASAAAFNKLVNMLVFLYSIDSDKDASNDILIADGMGTLLEGVSIDFSKDFWTTNRNYKLKTVLVDAAAQNLVDSTLVIHPAFVLTNFYNAQGVNHSFVSQDSASHDDDGDGTTDAIYTYTYDSNGNRLKIFSDTNVDGITDGTTTNTYDSNGKELTLTYDVGGIVSYELTNTYDSNGNRQTQNFDSDGDGTVDEITTYTYDSYENVSTISIDTNGDGAADLIFIETHDTNGNTITSSTDSDGDGTVDRIITNTYDGNENRISYSTDTDADGTVDKINTYTWDSNNNQLSFSADNNANGAADPTDYIDTYTYDSDGNRLTYLRDMDADGTTNQIYTYTYDSDGNRLSWSKDTNGDGTADDISTYTYDSDGNQLTNSKDTNGDGTADEISTYTYDSDGNKLTYSKDTNGDGTVNRVYTYTYSPSSIGKSIYEIVPNN